MNTKNKIKSMYINVISLRTYRDCEWDCVDQFQDEVEG